MESPCPAFGSEEGAQLSIPSAWGRLGQLTQQLNRQWCWAGWVSWSSTPWPPIYEVSRQQAMLLCRGGMVLTPLSLPWGGVPHPPTRPCSSPLSCTAGSGGWQAAGVVWSLFRADWEAEGTLVWGQGPLGW